MRVQLDYVEPEHMDTLAMLEGALIALEDEIPEVQTQLVIQTSGQKQLQFTLGDSSQTIDLSNLRNLRDLHQVLQYLYSTITTTLPATNDIDIVMIRGLLARLDPHSVLLTADIYQEFKIVTSGEFAGVGLMIGIRDQELIVISPIDGSPAARADIRPKDRIVKIDNEETANITLTDSISRLRGETGSKIILHIMRKGFTQPQKYELTREVIKINSVVVQELKTSPNPIRYIRIKNFQEHTLKELYEGLENLQESHGLILDLRNNPGGLLEQAINMSDLFLTEEKVIVSTLSHHQQQQVYKSYWPLKNHLLTQLPIVILVNAGSASASEIVAAALKKHQRAVLLGEQTFGKGSVQSVWDLDNGGALKLTIAQYLTPNNKSIQSVGVTPNILLYPAIISKEHIQLSQKNVLPIEKIEVDSFSSWISQPEVPEAQLQYYRHDYSNTDASAQFFVSPEPSLDTLENDFFVQFAKQILLENLKKGGSEKLLNTALALQPQVAKKQEQEIIQALDQMGVDWNLRETTPEPSAFEMKTNIEWTATQEPHEWKPFDSSIPVNSELHLQIKVTNVGTRSESRLLILTESPNPAFHHLELPVGYLEAGKTRTQTLNISIPEESHNALEVITLKLIDSEMQTFSSQTRLLPIKCLSEPRFQLTLTGLDDGTQGSEGNGDGLLQTGETIVLQAIIHNEGPGEAQNAVITLKDQSPDLSISKGRSILGKIKPNESKTAFLVFKKTKDALSKLNVEIQDADFGNQELIVPLPLKQQLPNGTFQATQLEQMQVLDTSNQPVAYQTSSKRVNFKGQIEGQRAVKDMYVFINQKKIFYGLNSDKESTLFPFDIPLELSPGYNEIVIHARNLNDIIMKKSFPLWSVPAP
ncbi:S41 family peptidase [Deltaproteobacteria bacterium TL4]